MRRKLIDSYPDEPNRWVVSYADFTTMLLALFIVLYAVSQLDIAQMNQFANSLKKSLMSVQVENKKEISKLKKIFATTATKIVAKPVIIEDFKGQIEQLKEKLKEAQENVSTDMVQLENLKKQLEDNLNTQNEISMIPSERGLTISFADTVLFESGEAVIKPSAKNTLEEIVSILKPLPNSIRIEGHTDDQPINTSQYPSNWELSTARATSMVKMFIDNYGFSPEKLSAAGYGEHKPVAPNTTPEGRQNNRRVDIVILSSGSQIFEPESN